MKKKRPVTPRDKALSAKHLRESIAFNEAHSKDHKKEAKAAEKLLKSGNYLGSGTIGKSGKGK